PGAGHGALEVVGPGAVYPGEDFAVGGVDGVEGDAGGRRDSAASDVQELFAEAGHGGSLEGHERRGGCPPPLPRPAPGKRSKAGGGQPGPTATAPPSPGSAPPRCGRRRPAWRLRGWPASPRPPPG